ncbi:MAG: D-aminoacyl-tRNA deacylase [bacterium]
MKAVVQRVVEASVEADGRETGRIGRGLLIFLGVAEGDDEKDAERLAGKIVNLRVFENEEGKMHYSVKDLGLKLLAISQFTLLGNCERGNRPDFTRAAAPRDAERLYERFKEIASAEVPTESGVFGAKMKIAAVNDGPVTIILNSRKDRRD